MVARPSTSTRSTPSPSIATAPSSIGRRDCWPACARSSTRTASTRPTRPCSRRMRASKPTPRRARTCAIATSWASACAASCESLRRRADRRRGRDVRRLRGRLAGLRRTRPRPSPGSRPATGSGSSPTATTTCSRPRTGGSASTSTGSSRPSRPAATSRGSPTSSSPSSASTSRVSGSSTWPRACSTTTCRPRPSGMTTVWIDRRHDRPGRARRRRPTRCPDLVFPDMASFAAAATAG